MWVFYNVYFMIRILYNSIFHSKYCYPFVFLLTFFRSLSWKLETSIGIRRNAMSARFAYKSHIVQLSSCSIFIRFRTKGVMQSNCTCNFSCKSWDDFWKEVLILRILLFFRKSTLWLCLPVSIERKIIYFYICIFRLVLFFNLKIMALVKIFRS